MPRLPQRPKAPTILVGDALHFSPRKLPPLYAFAAKNGLKIRVEASRRSWCERTDAYRGLCDHLTAHRQACRDLPLSALAAHRYRDIDVSACARAELMRLSSSPPIIGPWPTENEESRIPASARAELRETVLLCIAAARDWIDFWHRLIDRERPFACVAHGHSAIHSRTLLEVAAQRGIRAFVSDRFSTGRHYFFEEWRPGADRPLLADPAWYDRLVLPSEVANQERLRAEALRQLAPIREAVAARPASEILSPPIEVPAVRLAIVLGRAIGNPSLLDAAQHELALAAVHQRLIVGLLDYTDLTIVVLIDDPPSAASINEWRGTLPPTHQARFRITTTAPLEVLLSQAELAVSLSVPLALEACQAGLKPVQFGLSAVAGKGFTHDFADPADFIAALNTGGIDGRLSLREYRDFQDFLVRLLLLHLVPEGPAGAAEIGARMAVPNHLPTLQEPDFSNLGRPSLRSTISAILANPTAALRLARPRPSSFERARRSRD